MGRRGPRPKPLAQKRLEGTLRKSRMPKHPVEPRVEAPAPPRGKHALTGYAQECWETLVPELKKLKLLAKIDRLALEGLCQAYGRAREADDLIAQHGMLVRDVWDNLRQNPAVSISRASWSEVRRFAQEFGLTPSARSRVEPLPDEEKKSSAKGKPPSAREFFFGSAPAKVVGSIGS